MTARLTTHVLDITNGRPAAGVALHLTRLGRAPARLCTTSTNADGRCDAPLLDGEAFTAGIYELVFAVGPYFAALLPGLPTPPFLDEVILRFGVAAPVGHYHVPLLVSPYGYSTYRGS